jgi:2-amino-4-hydroxy-6-hydroxymethyldihydropteridine diphosphokinase
MAEVGFGIGSNVGDKGANIAAALERLFGSGAVRFAAASAIYRTEPWGFTEQEWFANACAVGDTDLAPEELLTFTQGIERDLGRQPTFRWGPRVIDIDILYYSGRTMATDALVLPHRELFSRAFALVPLAEIRPGLVLGGRPVAEAATAFGPTPLQRLAPPWSPRHDGG